jgi:hypothetical protein
LPAWSAFPRSVAVNCASVEAASTSALASSSVREARVLAPEAILSERACRDSVLSRARATTRDR